MFSLRKACMGLCSKVTKVFGYLYTESLGFTEVHFSTYLHGNCTYKPLVKDTG